MKINKVTKIILWFSAFALLLICATIYWQYRIYRPSTDDAYVKANIIYIAPQVSGPIKHIYIKNNQIVKKGQKLLMIDPEPFQIALNAAAAKLTLAKQNMQALIASVASAKANLVARQSELKYATKTADRILTLVNEKQAPKASADEATNKLKVAKAAVIAAKQNLISAEQNLGSTGSDNAAVKLATSNYNKTKLDLSYTTIYAPKSGKVVNFTAQVGNMLTAGQILFNIVEQNKWWVDANFKETQFGRLKPGQHATITTDMYPDYEFHGKLTSISAGSGSAFSILPPENATGNWVKVTQRVPVKIVITNATNKYPLRVGISASVVVKT